MALTEMGLVDEYEFLVPPRLAGHGPTPTPFAGLSKLVDLKLVSRLALASGWWRCGTSRKEPSDWSARLGDAPMAPRP